MYKKLGPGPICNRWLQVLQIGLAAPRDVTKARLRDRSDPQEALEGLRDLSFSHP